MGNWKHTLELFAVSAVLLLAAYLRMGQSGIVEYKRDEANLAQLAINVVETGELPTLGIGSSVGIPNAPVNVYILVPPYLIKNAPELATQYIGFLNVLAILIVYVMARRYIHPIPALIVILALSVNPWAIIFSRKIWAQNMLLPFITATIGTGILGFIEEKRWAKIAHFPLLAITGQIHYGAFVIIPVSAYLLWSGRRNLYRTTLIGILLMGLVSLPYLIGMLTAGYNNLSTIRDALSQTSNGDSALQISDQSIEGTHILVSGKDLHALAGPEQFKNYLDTVPDVYMLFEFISVGIGIAALWLIIRSIRYRDARTPVDIVLLLWLFSPIVAYSLTWTPFFIHYLIPLFPAAFLILGFGIHDLVYVRNWRPIIRQVLTIFLVGALTVVFFFQVNLWLALLTFVDENYTPDGFGTPLHYLTDVRDAILQEETSQVIGDLDGQALVYDDGPTVWNTLLTDVSNVRFVDHQTSVYPSETATLLTNECTDQAEQFALREGEGCYALERISPEDFTLGQYTEISQQTMFANGVLILGYTWDSQCLELAWSISSPTEQDYSFAINFYDDTDERIAQADALSWPGVYWRPGDTVIRQFCGLEPLPDASSVSIGMYIYDGMQFFNVDILDEAGNPAGQTVEIELN